MKILKKAVLSALAIGFSVTSVTSNAAVDYYYDFTVDETSNGGVGGNTFIADKINGGYTETATFNPDNTFDTVGYGNFGQYFANEGSTLVSSDLNNTYGLYSVYHTEDGVVGSPAPGITSFTGGTGGVELWIDANQDTTLGFSGDGLSVVRGGGLADDFRVAFSDTLIHQVGLLTAVGGFYDLLFGDVQLTDPEGMAFFPDLPFVGLQTTVDGDFDTFTPVGQQSLSGDVSIVFATVPEPSLIAMLGVGLIGMGFGRRKVK